MHVFTLVLVHSSSTNKNTLKLKYVKIDTKKPLKYYRKKLQKLTAEEGYLYHDIIGFRNTQVSYNVVQCINLPEFYLYRLTKLIQHKSLNIDTLENILYLTFNQ